MKNTELLSRMTLEEKVSLLSGKDFWHLRGNTRLGLPELMITDGPHGLRKQNPDGEQKGLSNSVPTTCFPTAVTTACSWDPDLLYRMGEAMAKECLQEKVSVILGPGVNMKRSPLCGRNFEYFSEDPLLAGELAAGLVNGIQSKGVGTSVKHFAVNSQEKKRLVIDSVIDERAMREIYLTAFEIAVKKSQPWTVMNSYNKVNGTYASDNGYLQNDILRGEWGFKGIVVSDWGAVNDRVVGLKNGNDLEMPSSNGYNDKKICDAVRNGTLDEKYVDLAADRMITLIKNSEAVLGDYTYDKETHHQLAAEVCRQSVVLLKNEDNILPLKKDTKIAVIGEMARAPRYQGAGSSLINPTKLSDAFDSLIALGFNPLFAPGYNKKKDVINETMIRDAKTVAAKADVALVFIGLTEEYESEGYDRSHLRLPVSHLRLLTEVLEVNKNVVVVLSGGSPVEMPFINDVKAVLNGYLGGQASGIAIADILAGKVNPSGKLAETYPAALSDTPCFNYYPGTELTAEHREGIYIGYRYYDTAMKEVLFPFGFGLSYTKFEYSDIRLSASEISDSDTLTVSYKIKNTGEVAGAEISQIYVSDIESTVFRPVKELRGFNKVYLMPGEEKEISVELSKRAFAYYNVNIADWHVEGGDFLIAVGASSRDIRLEATVKVNSTVEAIVPDYRKAAPCYYTADVQNVSDEAYRAVLGREIPPAILDPSAEITFANSLSDAKHTKWGARVNALLNKALDTFTDPDDPTTVMVKAMALEIPIRSFVTMSAGVFTEEMGEGLLMILNSKSAGRGLTKILKGLVGAVKNIPELLKAI